MCVDSTLRSCAWLAGFDVAYVDCMSRSCVKLRNSERKYVIMYLWEITSSEFVSIGGEHI
jgi:hypothetical protein